MVAGFEIIQKGNKSRKNLILQPIAVYCVLLAVFAVHTSVFKVDIALNTIGIILLPAIGISYYIQLIKWNKKRIISLISILLLLFAVGWIWYGKSIETFLEHGFSVFYNSFIKLYNVYYEVNIPLLSGATKKNETLIMVFLIQFLLGLIVSYVMRKGKGMIFTVIISLLPVVLSANVGYIPGVKQSLGLITAVLFYVLCYKNQEELLNKKEVAVAGIFLSVIFAASAVITPIFQNYVDQHSREYEDVRNMINEFSFMDFKEKLEIKNIIDYSEGGVRQGDFSELSQFRPKGKLHMDIVVTEKPKERVYLRGYVGTEYTSEGWRGMDKYTYLRSPLQTEKSRRQLMSEPFQRVENSLVAIDKNHIKIELKGASTNYAYTPYYALIPRTDRTAAAGYVEGNGKTVREYDYYSRDDVKQIESDELGEASALWKRYQGFVGETYLDYPEKLEQLKSMCSDVNLNSIDETAQFIDEYFQNNLSYSYEPGQCPENEDFIEYFLFSNHKGFCVHFATAATVIYRICGYPARYVGGYAVDSDEFVQQSDGTYIAHVTDGMAHAWCETFDREKGWQVAEHTLGYDDSVEEEVQDETEDNMESVTGSQHESNNSNRTDISDDNNQTDLNENVSEIQETTTQPNAIKDETSKNEEKNHNDLTGKKAKSKYIIIGMFFAIVIILLQGRIRQVARIRRLRQTDKNTCVINIYSAVYDICIFQGMKKSDKPDREIMENMKVEFTQLDSEEWEWMYDCVEKAAFAQVNISREEYLRMYRLYRRFRKDIMSEMSIGKRIIFLYGCAM